MAVMTTKRKVRKDFDPAKQYSVDVEGCSEEEKKEVQQAFFDAGFRWKNNFKDFSHLNAVEYTNIGAGGDITAYCMYGSTTEDCNMSAQEFLERVYEPQKGYVHAELMLQFAEDAQTHTEPWKLWQFKVEGDVWCDCPRNPHWRVTTEYRRKPKTKLIHGVEIPDFEFIPKVGEKYYTANVGLPELFEHGYRSSEDCTFTQRMTERGLIYPYSEEGKQATILHSKAMLGIA